MFSKFRQNPLNFLCYPPNEQTDRQTALKTVPSQKVANVSGIKGTNAGPLVTSSTRLSLIVKRATVVTAVDEHRVAYSTVSTHATQSPQPSQPSITRKHRAQRTCRIDVATTRYSLFHAAVMSRRLATSTPGLSAMRIDAEPAASRCSCHQAICDREYCRLARY